MGERGGRGGDDCFSKDDIQKRICIKFKKLNFFFLNSFLHLSHSNEDSVMNLEFKIGLLVKKNLKIDKKPAILRFIHFYHFEGLLKAMKDKIIFGFYFFLVFSR